MTTSSDQVRSSLPTYYTTLRRGIDVLFKVLLALSVLMVAMALGRGRFGLTEIAVVVIPLAAYIVVGLGIRALLFLLVDIADGVTELRLEARKRNPDV
jgi:hypothetical protein